MIGGIVSPVHDSYGKQGLVSSRHRLIMCQLAVQNSDWIRVDPWECYQDTWQTTCSVLEHHRDLMKVSWVRAEGGWMSRMRERGGGGGCWPAALASTSCEVDQPVYGTGEDGELGPWHSTHLAPQPSALWLVLPFEGERMLLGQDSTWAAIIGWRSKVKVE